LDGFLNFVRLPHALDCEDGERDALLGVKESDALPFGQLPELWRAKKEVRPQTPGGDSENERRTPSLPSHRA